MKTFHDDQPSAYDELKASYLDTNHRQDATKVKREDAKLGRRQAPPHPSPKLNNTKDLEALYKELQAKAAMCARLGEQARAAEWDKLNQGGQVTSSDEVNYGLMETFARNVARRIKRILGHA